MKMFTSMKCLAGLALIPLLGFATPARAADDLWVTGYYRAMKQDFMPPGALDLTVLTHVIHFSIIPGDDGSLDTRRQGLTEARITNLVATVHAAHRQALICVGGADSGAHFAAATAGTNLPAFVRNLTNFVAAWNYDGVDLDWEPLLPADNAAYTNLVLRLRAALDGFSGHKLLTTAINPWPKSPVTFQLFAALQTNFDQINLMSYHTSGPHRGWITWFNAPLYSGGTVFHNGRPVPAADQGVTGCLAAQIARDRLGLGLAFYGMVWTGGPGVTGPREPWPATNPPVMTDATYPQILARYYRDSAYRWDAAAQVPYLSITNAVRTNSLFISYEDPRSCTNKVAYTRTHRLGGLMIWELAQDYSPNLPAAQRNPLLSALKSALAAAPK